MTFSRNNNLWPINQSPGTTTYFQGRAVKFLGFIARSPLVRGLNNLTMVINYVKIRECKPRFDFFQFYTGINLGLHFFANWTVGTPKFSWLFNQPPPGHVPPPRNKGLIAGLIKGGGYVARGGLVE